jgi:hypothetical protein
LDSADARQLRGTEGATTPFFSPDGEWIGFFANSQLKKIFYRNGDKMMVVDITTKPAFLPGKPRVLFEGRYAPTSGTIRFYDVTRDGRRFLMLRDSEEAAPSTQINLVLHWTEELKRLVPRSR